MSSTADIDRSLVDYLLGGLSETERVSLEARLFNDEALDERLLATTDEIIEAYLAGGLSARDRQRFETHFLAAADHRERLAFMRALQTAVDRKPEPAAARKRPRSRSAVGWWLLAAAVVAAIVALLRFHSSAPPREAEAPSPAPLPSAPSPVAPNEPARTAAPVAVASKIERVRLPRRTTAPVDVAVGVATRVVRMEVAVDDHSPSFDAVLRAADGREVWRREGLAPEAVGAPLVVEIPARVLVADAYSLRVEGDALRDETPPVLEYQLRVSHGH
jgi:hypothetical protein